MKFLIPILLAGFAIGCSSPQEEEVSLDGVSIICPEGWIVKDQENYNDIAYTMIFDKVGVREVAIYTIGWINLNKDLEEYLAGTQQEQRKEPLDVEFGAIVDSTYGTIASRAYTYSFTEKGVEYKGIVHAFHHCDKTIGITAQGREKDFEDIAMIEKSFSCSDK